MIMTIKELKNKNIDEAKTLLQGFLALLINFISVEIVTINLIFIVLDYFSIKIY